MRWSIFISAKATHQIAEANQARNEQLKAAFGLSEFYKDGTSMDPQRKAREEAAKALAMAQKKYTWVLLTDFLLHASPLPVNWSRYV